MSTKIYAICSGGDWYDASVDHVIVPEGINIEDESKKCEWYYYNVYCKKEVGKRKYYNLTSWLVEKCGGRAPTEDELEVVWEG